MKSRFKSMLMALVLLLSFIGIVSSQENQRAEVDAPSNSLGMLFTQVSTNPEVNKEVIGLQKNSLSIKIIIIWYVTLLFLAFVSAINFYRQRMLAVIDNDVDNLEFTELENIEWKTEDEESEFRPRK